MNIGQAILETNELFVDQLGLREIVREGRVKLSLVRAHTRGNARKGIVLKKRNITA